MCVRVHDCKHEDIFLHSQSLPVTSGSQLYPSNTHWNIYTPCTVTSMTYVLGGVFEIKLQWIWAHKHSKRRAGACVYAFVCVCEFVVVCVCVCFWRYAVGLCVGKQVQYPSRSTVESVYMRLWLMPVQCSIWGLGLWNMAKKYKFLIYYFIFEYTVSISWQATRLYTATLTD